MKITKNLNNKQTVNAKAHSFTTISSFVGTDIGDPYSHLAEKNPRTAKHVITLFWSWSPAHSRRSEYRLATDRHRKTWNLYEITNNPESRKPLCCRVATGEPYKGIPAENAAYQLLLSTWDEEIKQWDFDPKDFEIDSCGLLNEIDVNGIIKKLSVNSNKKNKRIPKITNNELTLRNKPEKIHIQQNLKKDNEVSYWQKLIDSGKPQEFQIENIIDDFVKREKPIHYVKFNLQHDKWAILSWLFQEPDKVFFAVEKLAKKDLKTVSIFLESIMDSGASAASNFTSPYIASGGAAWIVGKFITKYRVIIALYAQSIADQLNISFSNNLRIGDLPFWGEGYVQELLLARSIKFDLKKTK
jgi:hypothetical protein